ncbi:MAG: hypothetical protein KBC95_00415 [Candidatus Peribacteraceae bacterium]|nr:hypothetical protein [Candidatus Peribacteraceae bacterium]
MITASLLNGAAVESLLTTPHEITGTDPKKFESATDVYLRAPGDGRPYALYAKMYGFHLRATADRELVPANHVLTPQMLMKAEFEGYFGYHGCDSFAKKLLGFAESRSSWGEFTAKQLAGYEHEDRNARCLHVFKELGYLRCLGDGRYQFTIGFVNASVSSCKGPADFRSFLAHIDD